MLDSIRPWSWPLRKLRGTYQYLFLRWEDWVPHLLRCIVILFLGCPFDIFKLPELVWILFDCLVFYRVFHLEIMSPTIYYPKYHRCLWAEIQFSWLLYLSFSLVSKLNCSSFLLNYEASWFHVQCSFHHFYPHTVLIYTQEDSILHIWKLH